MSKLQRIEDEMYEVAYMKLISPLCRICKHHHGQIYGGVEQRHVQFIPMDTVGIAALIIKQKSVRNP